MNQEQRQLTLVETALRIGFKYENEDQGVYGPDSYVVGIKLREILNQIAEDEEVFNSFQEMNDYQQFEVIDAGIRTAQQSLVTKYDDYIRVAMEHRMEDLKDADRQKVITDIAEERR